MRRRIASWAIVALLGCGSEPATPAPAEEPERSVSGSTVEGSAEAPTAPTEAPSEPSTEAGEPSEISEISEARRGFRALLTQLETVARVPSTLASPSDCVMQCAFESDDRLLTVTPRTLEEDGTPGALEVRVTGREPSIRSVAIEGSDEAWQAYQEDEGPPPWLAALRRAMPALPASRPARDLVVGHAEATFSSSAHAPLVSLGGALEGRYLYWHTSRFAHHLYLVHGPDHQMRVVGSLPLSAEPCDGDGATTACVPPLGIGEVYAIPGAPSLLVRVFHPAAGDGGEGYSTLVVSLEDDAALRLDLAQERREMEASLAAPGARVRAFSIDLIEGAPCDAGCVYFRDDRTFAWSFPEALRDGQAQEYVVRRRDGTLATPPLPAMSASQAVREELGDASVTLARDLIARAAVAAWNGFAYSPVVELGPPHMRRRLVVERGDDADRLIWLEGEARHEVARLAHVEDVEGPWGIDRVLAPEGAGYPLIVVAVAPLAPTRAEPHLRHRVALTVIARDPTAE